MGSSSLASAWEALVIALLFRTVALSLCGLVLEWLDVGTLLDTAPRVAIAVEGTLAEGEAGLFLLLLGC